MERTLVSICGLSNVGKTSAAQYLEAQYGAHAFSNDDLFDDMLVARGLPRNRANRDRMVREYLLAHAEAEVADWQMARNRHLPNRVFVNDGERFPGALARYRQLFGRCLVLHITAPDGTRLRRAHRRGSGHGESALTAERMLAEDRLDFELRIPEIAAQATAVLENDLDTFGIFETRLDRVMHVWQLAS